MRPLKSSRNTHAVPNGAADWFAVVEAEVAEQHLAEQTGTYNELGVRWRGCMVAYASWDAELGRLTTMAGGLVATLACLVGDPGDQVAAMVMLERTSVYARVVEGRPVVWFSSPQWTYALTPNSVLIESLTGR
jgi:hypothetical protein